ncbi:tRNA-intron lyase [Halobacteriales archaeon SW_8_65_20]|nr:MAG: tRNA-intron lyase [Halobacteriales archaeon SW_8_65_20]
MKTHVEGETVRVGHTGREQFYDARGYGHPVDGELSLSRVETAHLLYRGDIDAVDGMGFREFLATEDGLASRFLVYKDLRDRGFYLTPAREAWVDDPDGIDFVVYPRGDGPWDDTVAYRVRVVAEREPVSAADLGDVVLAVVDEESELTYLETSHPEVSGTAAEPPAHGADAVLLDDRAVVWEPPERLHATAFYGQPLDDDRTAVQLSLVEGAYLAAQGVLSFPGGRESVLELGRDAEGDRFDRRLAVYTALRASGVVPKTGFKFGAEFRTYADVSSVEELGHSERLVRVLPTDHTFAPRDLSLDIRLAHGVRKEMVFAFTDGTGHRPDASADVEWLSVQRLTP